MFQRYFEDELQFLAQMGDEFARAYPHIAAELRLKSRDPDVERLLQGVAFLTGRIRQSLDAEFPRLLHPLLQLLVPHALRPTPSAGIVELRPLPNARCDRIARGARIQSVPIDGTRFQFRTCFDTDIMPFVVEAVRVEAQNASQAQLKFQLQPIGPGLRVEVPLRLHLCGSVRQAYGLYLWLGQHLRRIRLCLLGPGGAPVGDTVTLPAEALKPVGFSLKESLLPYGTYNFTGYRHLQEYFCFPAKFLFYDLHGLERLSTAPGAERIEVTFDLTPLQDEPLQLDRDNLRLNCVPVINLGKSDAIVQVNGRMAEYHLRPLVRTSLDSPHNYDVFSIEKVEGQRKVDGRLQRDAGRMTFHPFFSFHRPSVGTTETAILYQLHLRPPVSQRGPEEKDQSGYPPVEVYLSFVDSQGQPVAQEATISVQMLVTNRDLPFRRLGDGDLSEQTPDVPSSINITKVGPLSPPAPACIGQDGLWRFFSHLLWGWSYLRDPETLRAMLALHHFPAMYDRRAREGLEQLLRSIEKVEAYPDHLVHRLPGRSGPPAVLRGTAVRLHLDERNFTHAGEVYLFGAVLDHFLAETASVNTFSQLTVHGQARGLEFRYQPRAGRQDLLSDSREPFLGSEQVA